jgi:hypothetical protein
MVNNVESQWPRPWLQLSKISWGIAFLSTGEKAFSISIPSSTQQEASSSFAITVSLGRCLSANNLAQGFDYEPNLVRSLLRHDKPVQKGAEISMSCSVPALFLSVGPGSCFLPVPQLPFSIKHCCVVLLQVHLGEITLFHLFGTTTLGRRAAGRLGD